MHLDAAVVSPDLQVTRLESIYKLEGLGRARKLLVAQSSEEQVWREEIALLPPSSPCLCVLE